MTNQFTPQNPQTPVVNAAAPVANGQRNPNVTFLSIEAFKTTYGITEFDVVRNPKTGKLFCSYAGGTFKCKGALDMSEGATYAILVDNSTKDFGAGHCLVNGGEGSLLKF